MKKFMCGVLVGVMVLACAPAVFAKSKITVKVDSEELVFDVEPQIINDRLMVPMRGIFEKLKAKVDYIETEKAVVSIKGNKMIRFVINSDYMEITDGNSETKKIALDSPATIIDGRTLVPARAVAESFGCGVSWDGNTRTVQINTDGTVSNPEPKKEGKWVVTKELEYRDDNLEYWTKYEYGSVGNATKGITYNSDGSVSSYNYYDNAGHLTKHEYYFQGKLSSWYIYEYDSAGNTKKVTDYYDGRISKWTEYEYDSVGKVIKATEYKSDGNLDGWSVYEYDSAGNCTKVTYYNPDGSLSMWGEYKYDSNGNWEWTTYLPDGSEWNVDWCKYEYDSNGNITKAIGRYGYSTVYEYTYIQ